MVKYWVILTLIILVTTVRIDGQFLTSDLSTRADDQPRTGSGPRRGDLGVSHYEYEYRDHDSPLFTLDWGLGDLSQEDSLDGSDVRRRDDVEGPNDDVDADGDDDDDSEDNGDDADDEDDDVDEEERADLSESKDNKQKNVNNHWLTHLRLMRENKNRWRRMIQRALHGQWDLNPFLSVNWDLRFLSERDKWWNGPNICNRTEEEEEDLEGDKSSIVRHHMISSSVCDDTGTVYKCTTTVEALSKKKKISIIYECCHGYQREPGKAGCTKELSMTSLLETVDSLGAKEMLDAIRGLPLTEFLESGNFTIFAPKDGIIGQYKPIQDTEPNVVMITPGLVEMAKELEETVMAHIVPGYVKTTYLEDEQLIPTLSQGNNIRINIYERPKSLVTANCHKIVSSDNMATNGVVHLVDGILTPVKESLASVVSKNPDLSMFKTVLGQSGLLSMLKVEGDFTLLAPSNSAFNRLNPDVRRKLLSGQQCIKDVIRNHLLPNVICSSILEGRLMVVNALNNFLNVTRSEDKKLFFDRAQVLETDIMATNGVIHIIDDVLIPQEAFTLLEVAEQMEQTTFVNLVKKAGLTKKFTQLHNYTLFLPTPEALQNVPEKMMTSLLNDTEKLAEVLLYHVLPSKEYDADLEHQSSHRTLNGKQVKIRNFKNFPFGFHSQKTVQCAAIEQANADVCGGVIHYIHRLLIPPEGNVFDLLQESSEFSELVRLMKKTGIADKLQEEGPFTVFAPTNKAFASLGEETRKFLEENPDKLKGLLLHHITTDVVCCSGVFGDVLSETRPTLDNRVVLTSRRGAEVIVNQVPIRQCDKMATNGILHKVDKILPEALNRYVTRHLRHNGRLNWHMHFGGDDFGRRLEDYVQNMLEHMLGFQRSRVRRDRSSDATVDVEPDVGVGRDRRARNGFGDWPDARRRHQAATARRPERMWDNWRESGRRKSRRSGTDGGRPLSADDPMAGVSGLSSASHWPTHHAHHWPTRTRDYYWPSQRTHYWSGSNSDYWLPNRVPYWHHRK